MTEVSPRRRVECSRWWIVALVLASACTHADGGASPSGSVAPSNGPDLQLRPVIQVVPRSSADWDETVLTCAARGDALADCVAASLDAPRIVLLSPGDGGGKYVLGAAIVDGNDVQRAIAQPGEQAGAGWIVFVDLAAEGTERFETATEAAVGSAIAIIIDGRIVSAPVVAVPISSGDVVVASGLTQREATALASRLDPERP
jgi:preprotein translocase subunit SecD